MAETIELSAVHTCPVWEGEDGPVIGLSDYRDHGFKRQPKVIGYCNVAVVSIDGTVHELLLNREPA